jgi:hypothetical protein
MEEEMIASIPTAQIGECSQFSDGREITKKSIVITPLRITVISSDSYKVSFGCNLWKACRNPDCSYCQSAMNWRE